MLWLASKLKIDHRLLTLAKGRCAETVLHLMKDDRSKSAVKASIEYGNGLLNINQLHAAAYAYAADARESNQSKTANICRELLTAAVFEKINNYK